MISINEPSQNKNINNLISSIISSYKKHYTKGMLGSNSLPDKDEVLKIVEICRRLLFPGYFESDDVNTTYMELSVGNLLMQAEKILQQQIYRALHHDGAANSNAQSTFNKACELSYIFLSKIPQLREVLLTDIQATFDGDPAARDKHEIIFAYPGIFAISVYRLAHELHLLSIPLIPRMMTEYAHSLTGIDIHPGVEIGRYFFIDHGTGVVIGETTKIGEYVKIYQGVTLGGLSPREGQKLRNKKRHPTIEDGVTIYSATSILGGETVIGKGSVIGSNAFITKSVPANTRVSTKNPELDFKWLQLSDLE